jgi:universal bacterial protein YeaZ
VYVKILPVGKHRVKASFAIFLECGGLTPLSSARHCRGGPLGRPVAARQYQEAGGLKPCPYKLLIGSLVAANKAAAGPPHSKFGYNPSMRILAIDTSTQAGSIAVLDDARVVGEIATWTEETYSSRMFRHLDFLLRELGVQMSSFDLYAVAAGPGSFTGLRVGLTAVKGWAEVYGKPIAAVSGLEAVAAQSRSARPTAAVMDARRGQIYGGIYERDSGRLRLRGEEMVLTAAEFVAHAAAQPDAASLVLASPTPEVLADALEASPLRGRAVETVSLVLAPVIGRIGLERARRGEVVDALTLDANYIRRSDAELLWKG